MTVRNFKNKFRTKNFKITNIDQVQNKKITKLNKIVKDLIPETKWAEFSNAGLSADYNGVIATLSAGLSQGLGDFGNRIGDEINMKTLRLRLQPYWNGSGPCIYRVIVFQYLNDPDGATSTASLINLLLHSTNVQTNLAPSTPYDHDNRDSFKVHYDKVFKINPQCYQYNANTNVGQSNFHKIDLKIPAKYDRVKYFANGTTTTKNELFFMVITDNANYLTVPYDAIVYYTDS